MVDVVDKGEWRAGLLREIEKVQQVHKRWCEGGTSTIAPGDDLYTAFEVLAGEMQWVDQRAATDVELLLVAWGRQWVNHKQGQFRSGSVEQMPTADHWKAWEALEDYAVAQKQRPVPPVESIKDLYDQKVPERQICGIYGFLLPNGSPDFAKIRQERDAPGTHVKPGFLTPTQLQIMARQSQLVSDIRGDRLKRNAKLRAATLEAPESIEELVRGGVSLDQICKMKRVSAAAVKAECESLGVPVPAEDYSGTLLQPGAYDRAKSPEFERAQDAFLNAAPGADAATDEMPSGLSLEEEVGEANLEEQVIVYAQGGMDARAIAAEVKQPISKVKAILKAAQAAAE